jgi:DNA-binding transcriptional MocR family regulator
MSPPNEERLAADDDQAPKSTVQGDSTRGTRQPGPLAGWGSFIPVEMSADPQLSKTAWRTMTALASFANKRRLTYVSHRKVAELMEASVTTVRRGLKELEARGYIRTTPYFHPKKSGSKKERGPQGTNWSQIVFRFEPNTGCPPGGARGIQDEAPPVHPDEHVAYPHMVNRGGVHPGEQQTKSSNGKPEEITYGARDRERDIEDPPKFDYEQWRRMTALRSGKSSDGL